MTNNTKNVPSLNSFLTRVLLLISGLIAVGIASTIFFAPDAFYANYAIDIGTDVSLANELKAPAGMLLVGGLLILTGVVRKELTATSLGAASLIYLSYGLSRLFSMATDGFPNTGLVSAAILELTIGTICLLVRMRHRKLYCASRDGAQGAWNAVNAGGGVSLP